MSQPDYEQWLRDNGLAETSVEVRLRIYQARVAAWGPLQDVEYGVIAAWLGEHSGWTKSTYHASMASIFKWLVETGQLPMDQNPMLRVRTPQQPRPRPRPLSDVELAQALEAATGRTRSYLMLGYLAGLRAHEIAKFHGRDIDDRRLRVLGKGGVDAILPTHPLLWELAQTYPREGFWFPSPAPHRDATEHIRAAAVTEAVRTLFRSLGIAGSSHRARHSYGTALLRGGANLRVVQDLMRHRSLATTAAYLGVSEEERSSAVGALTFA